jgi:uncharacterized protein (DUF1778 family)
MAQTRTKAHRLEARITASSLAAIRRAAEIQGRSVSDFVVNAAHEAAGRTIADAQILRLSANDQIALAKALLKPPPVAPALRRAIKRRARLLSPA